MTHRVCERIGDLQGSDGKDETHRQQIALIVLCAHNARARLKRLARGRLGRYEKGDLLRSLLVVETWRFLERSETRQRVARWTFEVAGKVEAFAA